MKIGLPTKLKCLFGLAVGISLGMHNAGLHYGVHGKVTALIDTSLKSAFCAAGQKAFCNENIETPDPKSQKKPSPAPAPTVTGAVYQIGGKRFTVTPAVRQAFIATEKRFGIPYDAMVAVCARESDCNPDSIHKSSGACGLFQLMTNNIETLYEIVYRYGAAYGYKKEQGMVEQYNRNQSAIDQWEKKNKTNPKSKRTARPKAVFGYRPVSEEAKEQLIETCKDPLFNSTMWAAYKKPNIDEYNNWLGNRTITSGELTAMNNLGLHGLKLFARKAWDPQSRSTRAIDFFKEHRKIFGNITSNETLIYNGKDKTSYKTIAQAYHEMMRFGGYGELKLVKTSASTLTQ